MGGGSGRNLSFGATWGSGMLPIRQNIPETVPLESFLIGRSLGAMALNYNVKDPITGKVYRFLEGSEVRNVEVFAGKGVRKKLNPLVARGLSEQIGGRPRDWKHVKGFASLVYNGKVSEAEVHWFEAAGQPKVKFKVKRWLS